MIDLETWIRDNSDKFYSVKKYMKVYTPYEYDKKYSDETRYEWEKTCKIKEAVEIPNDVLIGLQEYFDDYVTLPDNTVDCVIKESFGGLLYVRLSDVVIEELTYEENSKYEKE